ncbi:hypothetical protein C7431_110136 [Pantoea allii]|uniref:DNA invertase Pin-like site-specific DNA recombinase n=1 Tax=Pantoea allii TaxID=574096 RepID=A0A2V2B7E0_9GAMM|nr:hypothetical protein [Pantoea allii]PWK94640.1 hypothetical protein C7431_110136 [Pantoea allii]
MAQDAILISATLNSNRIETSGNENEIIILMGNYNIRQELNLSGLTRLDQSIFESVIKDVKQGNAIIFSHVSLLYLLKSSLLTALKDSLISKKIDVIFLDLFSGIYPQPTEEKELFLHAATSLIIDTILSYHSIKNQIHTINHITGMERAREAGKMRGRKPDTGMHEKIYQLRVIEGNSIKDTAYQLGISERTVIRVTALFTELGGR